MIIRTPILSLRIDKGVFEVGLEKFEFHIMYRIKLIKTHYGLSKYLWKIK